MYSSYSFQNDRNTLVPLILVKTRNEKRKIILQVTYIVIMYLPGNKNSSVARNALLKNALIL